MKIQKITPTGKWGKIVDTPLHIINIASNKDVKFTCDDFVFIISFKEFCDIKEYLERSMLSEISKMFV